MSLSNNIDIFKCLLSSQLDGLKLELLTYLDRVDASFDVDQLEWWKNHETELQNLFSADIISSSNFLYFVQ